MLEMTEQKMIESNGLVEVETVELQADDFNNCCRIVQFK